MAKSKRTSAARENTTNAVTPQVTVTRAASLPSQFRLASAPVDAAVGRTLAREVSKLDRNVLVNTARGLLSGQVTLQSVLSSLADAGSRAAGAAAKESQRAGAQQAQSSKQLLDQLSRTRTDTQPPRTRKDAYVVRGQVMLPTGEPAEGVVVEAIDRDVSKHDVLGTTLTDEKGSYEIVFAKKVFAESGEKEPEIIVAAGMEGRAPLVVTEPTRLGVGERSLTVNVTLPESAPPMTRVPPDRIGVELEARLQRVQQRQAVSAIQSQQFGAVMEQAQTALAVLAAMMQPPASGRATKSTTPAAPKARRRK